ncbi:UDP-glucosyltransferase 2-like [Anticarsia gemmatalis]|uniref:UDP-glucosyltransferase 2-like n=1 Tax=Anticarsia gemmatalis TaxID=129554 RepID=UPI003F75C1EE
MAFIHIVILTFIVSKTHAAKILAVASTNQEVFYPILGELAKKEHQLVFITSHKIQEKIDLENIEVINLQDVNYDEMLSKMAPKTGNSIYDDFKNKMEVLADVFETQMKNKKVQNLIKSQSFDLLLLQAESHSALIWSHIYKVPVIQISSGGLKLNSREDFGIPEHVLYPEDFSEKVYNLSVFDTLTRLYKRYYLQNILIENELAENERLSRLFPGVPPLSELKKNAGLLLLNVNSFWEKNRPLPRNVVYFGHALQKPEKELPDDLKLFLDGSEAAVYMSLKVPSSQLPPATLQVFTRVFSELPYKVLWKLHQDIPGLPDNVIVRREFPESDVFGHPNLKAIVTSGDLQTIQSAIDAAVPILGLPMMGDQWLNVEHCVQYGAGVRVDLGNDGEEGFRSRLVKIVEDPSYRANMSRLRALIHDAPSPPLKRAISWIEYVLQHGTTHLQSPSTNLNLYEYYEIELVIIVLSICFMCLIVVWFVFKWFVKKIEEIIAYQDATDQVI